MSVSTRVRFEIFKRDKFTCRYCGLKSPQVVLEVDHITPLCTGGSDDPINLITSCWECNRGKGGVPLENVITAEDPHDAAILILERRRQLEEYNQVLKLDRQQRESDLLTLKEYWKRRVGRTITGLDETWILNTLRNTPLETLLECMDHAIRNDKTRGLAYVNILVQRAQT
jgi:hypothetical protein